MLKNQLIATAKELNTFLELAPQINLEATSENLKRQIYEAGCLLEKGEQELSLSAGRRMDESEEQFEIRKEVIRIVQETLKELGVPLFTKKKIENLDKPMVPVKTVLKDEEDAADSSNISVHFAELENAFADIMRSGGGTKKEIIKKMLKQCKGKSKATATSQVSIVMRYLSALNYIRENAQIYTLTK